MSNPTTTAPRTVAPKKVEHRPATERAERTTSRAPTRRPGQAGGKRDTNRRERTEALHKSAIALFLERGVENVTVDEIAKAAGTAKGNFYRYAADKRELVEALIAPIAEAFDRAFLRCDAKMATARTTQELTPAYLGLAMELLEAVRVHPDVVQLWLQESRAPAVGARIPIADFDRSLTARTIALTELAHKQGLLRKIPPAISAMAVVGAVERLLIAYLRDGLFKNPTEVIQPLVRLVMEGIAG